MARVIVGTAGHIDHGKSALVRALTGTDPDRLPEEKRRGITIDLGYAFLGDLAAIIDVPGHERLIRNMVAGAATIDFALLVIAADDGPMPQTVEHLQILRLLGVTQGTVALTKCDNVPEDWLVLVEEQIRNTVHGSFLEGAPLFRVDSISQRGIPEFKTALIDLLSRLPARPDRGVFRLPIDRVFMIKGRGTVVTGTILSGRVEKEARLAVLPGGFDVRVKHLESHGQPVPRLETGQRGALNLIGQTESLARGCTLTVPGGLPVSSRVKVKLEVLAGAETLKDRQRIRFLIGTQEVIGRVQLLQPATASTMYANLLLESDVVCVWGDRFVLRRYSPLETLGGGVVLEPNAPRLRARDLQTEIALAESLACQRMEEALWSLVRIRGVNGVAVHDAAAAFGLPDAALRDMLAAELRDGRIVEIAGALWPGPRLTELRNAIERRVEDLHRKAPHSPGFSRAEVVGAEGKPIPDSVLDRLVDDLVASGRLVRDGAQLSQPHKTAVLSESQQRLINRIQEVLRPAAFTPPSSAALAETLGVPRGEIEKHLVLMERLGYCRRLGVDLFFDAAAFDRAIELVRSAVIESKGLAVADASRLLASSRKYVVPFLEYLDGKGITQRQGNVRVPGPKTRGN